MSLALFSWGLLWFHLPPAGVTKPGVFLTTPVQWGPGGWGPIVQETAKLTKAERCAVFPKCIPLQSPFFCLWIRTCVQRVPTGRLALPAASPPYPCKTASAQGDWKQGPGTGQHFSESASTRHVRKLCDAWAFSAPSPWGWWRLPHFRGGKWAQRSPLSGQAGELIFRLISSCPFHTTWPDRRTRRLGYDLGASRTCWGAWTLYLASLSLCFLMSKFKELDSNDHLKTSAVLMIQGFPQSWVCVCVCVCASKSMGHSAE